MASTTSSKPLGLSVVIGIAIGILAAMLSAHVTVWLIAGIIVGIAAGALIGQRKCPECRADSMQAMRYGVEQGSRRIRAKG